MALIPGTNSAHDPSTNPQLNSMRASGMPNVGSGGMVVTSTNISVWSNGQKVGFVQNASPSESRNITKVQALGEEGVVQVVPGNTQGGQMSLTRFAVYNSNIFNAIGLTRTGKFQTRDQMDLSNSRTKVAPVNTFGNPFKTLKDQRVPIELEVKTMHPGTEPTYFIETYLDCWVTSYSKTIASNTITISEQVTVSYSDVVTNWDK